MRKVLALIQYTLRGALPLLAGLLVLLSHGPAQADFFGLEPGARIKGHAGHDCKKCHSEGGGGGVERNKCLGCHDHRDLRSQIEKQKGLHSRPDYQKSCEKCHLEHKGERAKLVDWRPFGGMESFTHDLTGYELQGAHKRVKCTDCHKTKFEKSGTLKMIGLDQKCLSCHEDVHKFANTRKELLDCTVCHTYDARTIAGQTSIARTFNHVKVSDYPLKGAHDDIKCVDCHKGGKIFKMETRPSSCVQCHKDVHKNTYTQENRSCDKCHFEDKSSWKDYRFDHSKTKFPLTFAHARASCKSCHQQGDTKPMSLDCIGCHKKEDIHIVNGVDRFAAVGCNKCHQTQSWKAAVVFNHNQETKMKLEGKHASVGCTDCHRVKPKNDIKTAEDAFEKFKDSTCIGCHSHEKAHDKAFNQNPELCVKCHVPGTDNLRIPPHYMLSANFSQAGAHNAVACEKCHDEGLKKLKVGADCIGCHEDKHNGTLGKGPDCAKCHTEGFAFQQVNFNHNKDTKYPLEGRHAAVTCTKCHQNTPKTYQVKDQTCFACHGGQDVHQGKLGNECQKCHTPAGGALKFEHNTMTKFELREAHARADCVGCHASPQKTKEGKVVVDWQFRATGKDCRDCHGDRHGISLSASCVRCHGEEDWRTRIVDRYHDVPPFSLLGMHSSLECTKCHGTAADNTGMGTRCETCHKQDDIHAGALRECQQCHRVQGWMPSSFTHVTTGFPLQGVHRVLDCRNCHGTGVYTGMSSECISCHLKDFWAPNAVGIHGGVAGADSNCLPCHNQITWKRSPLNRRLP